MYEYDVEPVPSWPLSFAPQQYARLSVATPQVWLPPALSCFQSTDVLTAVGLVERLLLPVPNCPD